MKRATGTERGTPAEGGIAKPSDSEFPRSPMLAKVIQRMKEWEGLSPELFSKLVAEIEGRAQCADSANLLRKLAQIEKDGRQRMLVGQLKDAFGEGPIHEVLSREKDDRATNYTKTVRNLRSAAQSLDLL